MKFDDKEDLQTVPLSLTDGNYLFDVVISLWKHWREKKKVIPPSHPLFLPLPHFHFSVLLLSSVMIMSVPVVSHELFK